MSTDLASRYGSGRRPRLPIVIAVVIVVAFLAWLGWAVWGQSDPEVTSSQTGYRIHDHSASVTFDVHLRSVSVHATCEIDATASDHTVVGDIRFGVPTDRGKDLTLTRTLRTERRAIEVELLGCTAPGQKKQR